MKITAILIAASVATGAPSSSPPALPKPVDMLEIASGATTQITCQSSEGCLVVTVPFMRGYTEFVEQEASKACRRTDI